MKPVLLALVAATLAAAAASEPAAPVIAAAPPATLTDATGQAASGPVDAAEGVALEAYLYVRRPIVVFADSPDQPQFVQQMRLLAADPAVLEERDVVVVIDTDPAGRSAVRQRLRPRGFSLVLMEKDGNVVRRFPSPRTLREIAAAIDRTPLRRQEIRDRLPPGR